MANKRIILMYISEVSGHHSATIAVEKAMKSLEPATEVLNINAFNYTNPITEKIVNKLYMGVIKATPGVWDYLYDNPGIAKNVTRIKETIHKFNSPKLKALFDKFKPDAVACTQAFPCGMVADFKKDYNSRLPLVAILTDYIPHSYWVYDGVDYYITPSEEIGMRLVKKGVAEYKVKPLGIPFDPDFQKKAQKEQIFQELGLSKGMPVILIMGGGQGLGPIKTIVKSLDYVSWPLQEIVVCGTNKKIYKHLVKSLKKHNKAIKVFGYSDKIKEFMSIADIIITKPGGITTAEALCMKLPMIIVKPIPGQEANNTAYLTEKGAAIKVEDAKNMYLLIEDLFSHPSKLKCLADSSAGISKPNASLDIAKLILSLNNA